MSKRFGGAICIPSTCSSELARTLMYHIFNETDLILAEDYNQNNYCQSSDSDVNRTIDYFIRYEATTTNFPFTILSLLKQVFFTIL